MRAAYIVGEENIQIREVPEPVVPPLGIKISVSACGICGSDLRRWREGQHDEAVPLIAGHEIAGVVIEIGAGTDGFQIGDRVAVAPDIHCGKCYYCQHDMYNLCANLNLLGITPGFDGGFAEFMVLTSEVITGGIVHKIPDCVSDVEASLAEPLSSVLAAPEAAGVSLGDTVVVMGGGPIGCLHICVAKARGARVILSEPSAARRRLATDFDPELVIDPSSQDPVQEVFRVTDGLGADMAICANPVASTHSQALQLVRKRGTVVLFGGLPKSNPETTLDGNILHYDEKKVIGTFSYHPGFHQKALELIGSGLIRTDRIVTHKYSLEKIDQAFQAAVGGEALKVMVEITKNFHRG